MKKIAIVGKKQSALVDSADLQAKDDWVVVKIHAVPMCTEFKAFANGRESTDLGHEAAGEVVEVAQPGKVEVGDRVVVMPQTPCGKCQLCIEGDYIHCQNGIDFKGLFGSHNGHGTMGQYLLKPSWLLPKIPDSVSYELASLAECGLGPTFTGLDLMGVSVHDTVLIAGLGPVGLGGVVNASYRGARVIGVESNPWRAAKAKELGACEVIDPNADDAAAQVMDLTKGLGVDKSLDTSGVGTAINFCIDATRRKGRLALIAAGGYNVTVKPWRDIISKGLTIHGAWHYNLANFKPIMDVIQNSPVIDKLISHRFPMSKIQEAWETQVSGECAKIILSPWE